METTVKTNLVEGRIPAHTVCPFKQSCGFTCRHMGVDHDVPFSCACARLFDLDSRRMQEEVRNGRSPNLTGKWFSEK